MRNLLHTSYRSSKQFKQKRRLQQIRDGLIPTSGTTRANKSQSQCVSPDSSDDESSVSAPSECDTFGILFNAFGRHDRSDDPFAPTPILMKSDSMGQLTGSLVGIEPNPIVSPQVSSSIKTLTAGPSRSILEAFDGHIVSSISQV